MYKVTNLKDSYLNNVTLLLFGIFVLFASAQIMIPIKPVPITFQTLVVSLIGLTYNPSLAFITVSTYILTGIIGFPIFTKFGYGLNYLSGMTGGYLIGFLLAAPLMGLMHKTLTNNKWDILICCLIGHIIIYLMGVLWLSTFIGIKEALHNGFLVYIPSGILKIIIFSYLFAYIKNHNHKKY